MGALEHTRAWNLVPPPSWPDPYEVFWELPKGEIPDCDANLGARESGMRATHPIKTRDETTGLRLIMTAKNHPDADAIY